MSAPKRSGPFATVAKIVFALPFLLVGIVAFGAGLRDVLGGNMKSVAAFPFGVLFFGAGAFIVVRVLRETRSPEAQAAKEAPAAPVSDVLPVVLPAANYRSSAGTTRTARELYGAALGLLPVQKLEQRAGQVLPHSISLHAPQSNFTEIFFVVIWNGFTWPFFIAMVASGSIVGSLFSLLFVGIGAYILVETVRKFLARGRLPRVELSAEPAYLGDELEIHVDQTGPARIARYRVGVRCEELVKYTVGTDTRTEKHQVFEATLYDEPGLPGLGLGEHWTRALRLTLPAEAPASFESRNNQVLWVVTVHAEIAGWPDYDEGFAFRALPRPVA